MRILTLEEKEVLQCSIKAFTWDEKACSWSSAVDVPIIGPLSNWLELEPGCITPGAWMKNEIWAVCPQRGDAKLDKMGNPIDSLTDKTRVVPLRVLSQRMEMWEEAMQQKARDRKEVKKRKRIEQAASS